MNGLKETAVNTGNDKSRKAMTLLQSTLGAVLLGAAAMAGTAQAQVPESIYQEMVKIGHIVDPACTAKLYRGFMPANDVMGNVAQPYPGINVTRDVSFGSNPKDVVDILSAASGAGNRPVLIYVPGGGGNKTEQQSKDSNAFYDNIGRWATKNGMVGVLMQRHPGASWDDPAKDVSTMIQWLQTNVAKYQGNPDRMFIWAQSAGNVPTGTYLGRPEVWGPKGVGLKGAILMAGGFNIAPLNMPQPGQGGGPAFGGQPGGPPAAGSTCGEGSPFSAAGAIKGPSGMTPPPAGAPAGGPPGGGAGGPPRPDEATLIARSSLPALRKGTVKLMFVSPELDPGVDGKMSTFYQTLHDDLCKVGADKCPTMLYAQRHNHMSVVYSPDSPDTTVSKPVLDFIHSVK
jgi:hypothetical protein